MKDNLMKKGTDACETLKFTLYNLVSIKDNTKEKDTKLVADKMIDKLRDVYTYNECDKK